MPIKIGMVYRVLAGSGWSAPSLIIGSARAQRTAFLTSTNDTLQDYGRNVPSIKR
jgi:hypothetical protein